jgi:hypothetical protein
MEAAMTYPGISAVAEWLHRDNPPRSKSFLDGPS